MSKLRCLLALSVVLIFGSTSAASADDIPDTAYDESESMPYENTPMLIDNPLRDPTWSAQPALASKRAFTPHCIILNERRGRPPLDSVAQRDRDSLTVLNRSIRC